jgi:hypothetical protein
MISTILFVVLLWQRSRVDIYAKKIPGSDAKSLRRRGDKGLILIGVISLLNIYFNVTLHRGWWNGDFFSPFLNGFKA